MIIHSETSTAAHLKFGNRWLISSTFYNECTYLFMQGLNFSHVRSRSPGHRSINALDVVLIPPSLFYDNRLPSLCLGPVPRERIPITCDIAGSRNAIKYTIFVISYIIRKSTDAWRIPHLRWFFFHQCAFIHQHVGMDKYSYLMCYVKCDYSPMPITKRWFKWAIDKVTAWMSNRII